MSRICYRELRHYKYQLMEDHVIQTDIKPPDDVEVPDFIVLTTAGELTIRKTYAWDGASGPMPDIKSIMRGSLVHDALYQLMREKLLDYKKDREKADDLLRQNCLQDRMPAWLAALVYWTVRRLGEFAARPPKKPRDKMIYAP